MTFDVNPDVSVNISNVSFGAGKSRQSQILGANLLL